MFPGSVAQGYCRTTGRVVSLVPSENTCAWWACAISWHRRSILRPTASSRGITGPLNLTSTRSLRCSMESGSRDHGVRELLQQSALSQGFGERDSLERLRRSQGTDPTEAKGGSDSDFSAQTIAQSTTQRARTISAESPLAFWPISAEFLQSDTMLWGTPPKKANAALCPSQNASVVYAG